MYTRNVSGRAIRRTLENWTYDKIRHKNIRTMYISHNNHIMHRIHTRPRAAPPKNIPDDKKINYNEQNKNKFGRDSLL